MRPRILVTTMAVLLAAIAPDAGAAIYRVGAGSSCTHATIQSAIDTAAATPGVADSIRVTRSLAYDDVELDIEDQSVVLEGGYATCSTESPDGTRTILTGNGDDSVLRIRGHGDVTLQRLTLTGGHQPRFVYGYGGGMQISGGPHQVSLSGVLVTGNDAGHGGGISLVNDESDASGDVRLRLGNDTVVSNNSAGYAPVAGDAGIHGGGIYCSHATIEMNGDGSTSILSNSAQTDGGGIGAADCTVTIAPRGVFASFNGIVLNTAGRDGGGILAAGDTDIDLYTAHADRPVYVAANIAEREGGGIKLNSGAHVDAWDLILEGNRSYGEGGGVSVFTDYHSSGRAYFGMHGTVGGAPADAVNCNPALRCNRISQNVAQNHSDELQQAAAVRVKTTDNEVFGEAVLATAALRGTLIENNVGANLVRIRQECDFSGAARNSVELFGTAIVGNAVSGSLILNADAPYNCHGELLVRASTIAGNAIGGTNVIGSTDHVEVQRSIIWQPGVRVLDAGSLEADQVQYLLASDLAGIPASTLNFTADPRFVDLDHGDFHLQASSPAIDYAPTSSDPEADEQTRSVNLALVPDIDGFGPQDLGADERQSIGNLVRNAEFDEDLHIWTDATPAATNWGGQDHAGSSASGSIEIFDTSTATRVVGLRQCVGIPGPGVYKLSGFSWIHGDRFLPTPDHAILAWTYHPDSADCTGGVFASGESQAPNAADWRAITPQFIAVAPGDWSPNTTIGIELIQEKTANPIGSDSDLVRFDGIALVPDTDVIFADGFEP